MKLSIILAAYNVEKYIEKCITSCASQQLETSLYEIIVVNDGSTDTTAKICNKLAAKIKNLKLVHQENQGLGACRNIGLKESKGDYVWFIDGDDYIEENILQIVMSDLEQKKLDVQVLNYAVVSANYSILNSNTNKIVGSTAIITGAEFYKNNYSKSYTWSFIFRRSLFIKNEISFKERINMQDSEILPKLLLYCNRLSFLDKVCYYYVQHKNSFTNTNDSEKRFQYFKSIIFVRDSLKEITINQAENNKSMEIGLIQKINSLNEIIFNHLVYFRYKKSMLSKIIFLLKQHDFYPLEFIPKGKMKLVRIGLNNFPILTKKIVDLIIKN